MKKRIISSVLILILALCVLPLQALAGSLSNFYKINTYTPGFFTDVPNGEWYSDDVKEAYEYGLISGSGPATYSPGNKMTIAEAVKVSACLHSIFHTGSANFQKGVDPWYQPYVDYALANGLITPYSNYTTYATRSDMAIIFANALPDEAITPINKINDNAIPDVSVNYSYSAAVYKLYRAGILSGSGDAHAFKPNDSITRAEIAAIVARLANSGNRVPFTISPKELTPTEIVAKCSPAVFYIELYDAAGKPYASGSGFFIRSDGLAVTNFHVIDGAASARIKTTDESIYDVAGVYDYNEAYDLALIKINGSDFPYLELGDSSTVLTGEAVFAIGSPKGLDNTFSQGIISNASRKFSDSVVSYIQNDAAISHGSSGGALLNTKGQVIGVTTAVNEDGQNINFAVPINLVKELSSVNFVPLSTVASQKPNLTLTATPQAVSVARGSQATITFTVNSYDFYDAYYTVANESVVSCSWGDWSNYSIPLTITGLSAGSTTILLELVDENDDTIASATVSIIVSGSSSAMATYYPGFYPVPDFGAYTGAPLYFEYHQPSSGGTAYYYRLDTIPMSAQTYVGGYDNLMRQNGCSYVRSFEDAYGHIVMTYSYGNFYIYAGVTQYNGYNCYLILIITS